MKVSLLLALLILYFTSGAAIAQEFDQPGVRSADLKGQVKVVEFERVYVRMRGRNVGEKRVRIYTERYNESGQLVEETKFDETDGYSRTTYTYAGHNTTVETLFFDASGKLISEASTDFKKRSGWSDESGLCSKYTTRNEENSLTQINQTVETCLDSSVRSTTVDVFDLNHNLVRQTRTDAKGRVTDGRIDYDLAGYIQEYRHAVSGIPKPYTFTINYGDLRFDENNNWIRMTATSTLSTLPDELYSQYNENLTITYYDSPQSKR